MSRTIVMGGLFMKTGNHSTACSAARATVLRIGASTALAGSFFFVPMPIASAQVASVVSACSGVRLPNSVLTQNILAPVVNGIVSPVQNTVNPLLNALPDLPVIGTIIQPLLPANLSIDVTGILNNVNDGKDLNISVVDVNGNIVGPGADCITTADGFQLDTPRGIAIGGNSITGLGDGTRTPAVANEISAIAIGDGASTGTGAGNALALGTDATVGDGGQGSVALGAGAKTGTFANSVALGAGSTVAVGARASYEAIGLRGTQSSIGEVNIGNRTLAGLAPGLAPDEAVTAGQLSGVVDQVNSGQLGLVQQAAPGANITVGVATDGAAVDFRGTGGPRILTGVADGALVDGSSDAVTGNQLFDTNAGLSGSVASLGGGAAYDPATGTFTGPTYTVQQGMQATVGEALDVLDGQVTTNTTNISALTTQITNGSIGLVQQAAPGSDLTVGAGTDGAAVRLNQVGGATRLLTGLSSGAVADGSTDAVTGDQLFDTNTALVTALGAGAGFDPTTGIFTGPTFLLDGGATTVTTVGDAVTNLDGRTTANTAAIDGLSSGTLGLVQQAAPGANITVGAATDGAAIVFNRTGGGTRLLTGLSAGTLAAGSTDAVTGDQLFTTNAALSDTAASLGGGAGYDPATGTFTGPTYTVQNTNQTTVGGALTVLDAQVTTNTQNISTLTQQVNNGSIGLVQQAGVGADLTVGAATDGQAVRFNQAGGATRLVTGLSDGAVAAGSTDAVTGGQIQTQSQSIASALGGGAAVAADGTVTTPSYQVQGASYVGVGAAFAAVDGNITSLQNQISNLDPSGNLIYVNVRSTRPGAQATGTESAAVGGGAIASGNNSVAYGTDSVASGNGSSAFGVGSTATYDNSTAIGSGSTTTRVNQMAFGTASNTYTMPGITSAASRAAQSGPLDVVTTDAGGNLGSVPLSSFFSGVSDLEGRVNRIDRKLDRQSDGIAIAMALGGVNLPAGSRFAMTGNVGFFGDTAAFGVGAIGQVSDNVYLNGGVGVGSSQGTVAGRVGLTYAW